MDLSFTAGIIILALIWVFRNPIKHKAQDVEDDMKVSSVKSGKDRAKELIEINKEIVELGDIPDVDHLLDVVRGKTKQIPPITTTE